MGTKHSDGGYSADVEIDVLVDGAWLSVWTTGPNDLQLRVPQVIAPNTRAQLRIVIDGNEDLQDVLLPDGCDGVNAYVNYRKI